MGDDGASTYNGGIELKTMEHFRALRAALRAAKLTAGERSALLASVKAVENAHRMLWIDREEWRKACILAREEGRRAALEEAHRIVVEERDAYAANAKECDAAGNYRGGTMDISSVLTCERIDDRLRSLASPRGEGNESKEG